MDAPNYASDPSWSDITLIPQDDGGPQALATIAYAEEYRTAMSYLRAVMTTNEHSSRVLALTAHIISLNPAHYTVWLYRAKTLFAIDADIHEELTWLNDISLTHLKNYQIWHHRQLLVGKLATPPEDEAVFLAEMLVRDAKNYHVWSYRQWLVRRFGLWEGWGEMEEVERMLRRDVRNNSAWNHRWFLVFGSGGEVAEEVWIREVEYTKAAIRVAPQNESPWNYLRGLVKRSGKSTECLKEIAEEYASFKEPEDVRSSFALNLLADIYAEENGMEKEASQMLDLLAKKYDPIRAHYWNYRKSLLIPGSYAAS